MVAALAEGLADKWDSVGIFLGIPYKVIEVCRLEDTLDDRIQELTIAWIGRKYDVEAYGEPTWRGLVEAVAHKAGGFHRRLAAQLADNHPVLPGKYFPLQFLCFIPQFLSFISIEHLRPHKSRNTFLNRST